MTNRHPMLPQEALIACALFCDSTLELIDGDPRDFCLVSKRHGERWAQYTSNLAGGDRLKAVEMLMGAARRLLDAHVRERRSGG
jgi:hypothetical protein